jgi:hypothetical protein
LARRGAPPGIQNDPGLAPKDLSTGRAWLSEETPAKLDCRCSIRKKTKAKL